jgi:peptidoglycan/xylan/chitin deacetylase (PgdA/CDA1 family)
MTVGRTLTARTIAALAAAGLAATVLAGCGGGKTVARGVSAHKPGGPGASSTPTPDPRRSMSAPAPAPSSPAPGGSADPGDPAFASRHGLPPVLSRIPTKDKVVFVTIDDGWEHDADFAAYVRAHRTPFTVFLLNDAAKGDYGYFRGLQRSGAVIGDHTMTHPLMTRLSYAAQKAQICRAADIYTTQFGARPTLFRAPYGEANLTTKRAAAACGMKAIFFWREVSEHGNLEYQTPGGLKPGDIILVHFKPHMLRDFKSLLRRIQAQGFRPASVRDYLPASFFRPPAGR